MPGTDPTTAPSFAIAAVFAGGTVRLDPDGRESGIVKTPVRGRIAVDAQGLAGDVQCDRRAHGGPEKAVHQFAAASYRRLAAHAPECAPVLAVGSIGENLSAEGMDEANVHVGDVYQAGTTLLEVSQPRSPCWKIDARYGTEGLAAFIATHGITGWYYRVLRPGQMEAGDAITLVDRRDDAPSIERFWRVQTAHRPELAELQRLADAPGLSADWKRRLEQRLAWLRANR
jgi:MOSC domain-containing protein YiiM